MAIKLTPKDDTKDFSFNNLNSPIWAYSSLLDNSGSPANITFDFEVRLRINDTAYSDINLKAISRNGIEVMLSLNKDDWFPELVGGASDNFAEGIIGDVEAGQNKSLDVWIQVTIPNDGTVLPGFYDELEIQLTASNTY